jgi:hypothetical protein
VAVLEVLEHGGGTLDLRAELCPPGGAFGAFRSERVDPRIGASRFLPDRGRVLFLVQQLQFRLVDLFGKPRFGPRVLPDGRLQGLDGVLKLRNARREPRNLFSRSLISRRFRSMPEPPASTAPPVKAPQGSTISPVRVTIVL